MTPLKIQQRLPLLICILLLSIIATFSWISYIGIKNTALKVGSERLTALTQQLSGLFQQSAKAFTTATRKTATQEAIIKYLQSEGKDSTSAVLAALEKLRTDTLCNLVELLNEKKQKVLGTGKKGLKIAVNIDQSIAISSVAPDFATVGKMYLMPDSTMYYPTIAAVTSENKPIGYIVRWRLISTTPKILEQLSQLMGTGATLYFGNNDGGFWTDMIKPVTAPPVDKQHLLETLEYSRNGSPVMAAVRPVPGTSWLVMIEFSRKTVLDAATRFLYWIAIVGLALTAIGIFASWLMSRHITKPLNKLTTAATAIAGGSYSLQVDIHRRDELGKLGRAFNDMAIQIRSAHAELENKVAIRTAQLETVNKELEAFSYSVSHDLRAPLRAVSGYSMMLKEDYESKLDAEGSRIIETIILNTKKMGQLIDDLIAFSKMSRTEMMQGIIDMKALAGTCLNELMQMEDGSKYTVKINDLPACRGDQSMIKQVWLNLIGNAIKYSSKEKEPVIEIGCSDESRHIYYVRDNGVGFDMQYSHKLFGVFQRLHSEEVFKGTGIGLALAKRIINKHTGDIWAESSPGKGATFYFSLST